MKVLIVEDETAAYENLVDIIREVDSDIEILGNTESVDQTVKWLRSNPLPDLIFMDIHLSDGSAFAIFEEMEVETPIIFTTAYDEYAIEAFKLNSVDYLLKPIKSEEIKRALQKLNKWTRTEVVEYLTRLTQLSPAQRYKDKLLIPIHDKLLPVKMSDISCFYTTDKVTKIIMKDGKEYPYSKTLEQISSSLNPVDFCRANKQFIISRDSVINITIWFDNRLLITLDIETPERIYISKNKAAEFKMWVVQDVE
ncbi:MAG: LytTR family DNA-binding domain-containing protein [Prevotella sp.]|jgi:DNA-binding LytR/AlgR family response regulator|nr:LytTR family DNA-binding domain-containing protein [Prevotella sp.]